MNKKPNLSSTGPAASGSPVTSNVMRLKSLLLLLATAVSGAIVGFAVYVGYVLPAILPPPADLFVFLIDTDLGRAAMEATSGKAGILLADVLRAFPFSVVFGAVGGLLLYRLPSPRLFCYSTLVFPILTQLSWGYFFFIDIDTSSSALSAHAQWGRFSWVCLVVYGWYFLALFAVHAISTKFRRPNVV